MAPTGTPPAAFLVLYALNPNTLSSLSNPFSIFSAVGLILSTLYFLNPSPIEASIASYSKVDSRLFLMYYLNVYIIVEESLPCRE